MDIELLLHENLLQEPSRADYHLREVLRTAGVEAKDYHICEVDLFMADELVKVMEPAGSFKNALSFGAGQSLRGFPTEGVFAFKRNPEFKYVCYGTGQGQFRGWLEFVLIPTASKQKEEFVEYLVNEVADLEQECRQRHGAKKGYMDRLFLDPKVKNSVTSQLEIFLENREFYTQHNLPYKLGILLYGPPGNGKTLLIKAVGDHFGLPLTDLASRVMFGKLYLEEKEESGSSHGRSISRYECHRMVYPDSRPRIYYFEDIDKKLATGKDIPTLPANELLQVLDGVDEINNVIVIATTNHIHDLVDAIIARPGRFDVVQEIGLPGKEQRKQMFDHYRFTVNETEKLLGILQGKSMAFVENFIRTCILVYKKTAFRMVEIKDILESIESHAKLEAEIGSKSFSIG